MSICVCVRVCMCACMCKVGICFIHLYILIVASSQSCNVRISSCTVNKAGYLNNPQSGTEDLEDSWEASLL